MFLLRQIIPAALVALAVASVISLLGRICGRESPLRHVLTAFAVALGYACGHLFITGPSSFPPADTTNWLPYFAIGTALIVLLARPVTVKAAHVILLGFFAAGAFRLLLGPKFRYGWSCQEGWIWVIALALVVVLLASSLVLLRHRSSLSIELPLVLLLVCTGVSAALMLSGSLLLGQFAAALAAAVLGGFILLWRERSGGGDQTAAVLSLLLVMFLASGYFFAELPAASGALLAISPASALIPIPSLAKLPLMILRVTLVCVPITIAVIIAFRSSPSLSY